MDVNHAEASKQYTSEFQFALQAVESGLDPSCQNQIDRDDFVDVVNKNSSVNLIFLVHDRTANGREELKGFALITKATKNELYGFDMPHYFLHLICAQKGYGSKLMDSVLQSATED